MSQKRITKAEIELCFERFLLDADDEFFPDPFRYTDLRLMRNGIVNEIHRSLSSIMNQHPISYTVKRHYDWDVPKSNYVVRQGSSFHPYDSIIFHFVLNRLVPIIEPTLSTSRYSYRVKNPKLKKLFGERPTENWIRFKSDIKDFFSRNTDYKFLVSTDVAGFFEYIPIIIFKKQLLQMCNNKEKTSIELLNIMLRAFSASNYSGMPQNCEPFSYLCTAFLDFLDKELQANSIKHFRYVDDIKVACKTENDAKKAIVQIIRTLRSAHLNLNAAKTEIIPKNSDKFKQIFQDFPTLLSEVDNAIFSKNMNKINTLAPRFIRLTKQVAKQIQNFDDRLFRACIWRIIKICYFKNIDKLELDSIGKTCLTLLELMPEKSDTLLRFLVLHKNRKYVQDSLNRILQLCVYPWQEMLIWNLLIQSDNIKNTEILTLAKQRLRNLGYEEAVRNYIMIFLGKHGDYQDRRYIAESFSLTSSFRTKRCIIIALQEYAEKNILYNQITPTNNDLILVSIVKCVKQLPKPEYVLANKKIGTDIAIS